MEFDHKDPYKNERDADYARHNRTAIRALPFMISFYAMFWRFNFSPIPITEFLRDIFIIFTAHFTVEVFYAFIDKDNWLFTCCVFLSWSWLIYEWWFVENVSFISAFIPPLGLLLAATILAFDYDLYKRKKNGDI